MTEGKEYVTVQSLTVQEICDAAGGVLESGDARTVINNITADSRKADGGAFFVPLAGNRDGHDFIESAFAAGAAGTLTRKDISPAPGKAVVRVGDTLRAFGDIAAYYKRKYPIPTAAVIGSVGKTTTKDMLAGVFSQKYNTLKTEGNYNNEIGLPITVFRIKKEHEAAVLEMGMSGFGEIERLAYIGKPDIAVMTNIGISHIEKLGSRENIFKAKMEIVSGFGPENTLIANGDNDFLSTIRNTAPEYKLIYYGISNPENDIYAKNIVNKGIYGIDFIICSGDHEYPAHVDIPGEHNVYNALAAFAAGREFGIEPELIIRGIGSFELSGMRMSAENKDGFITINDCYNAAPDSIRASLRVLADTEAKRKIAVLGDVLELGEFARAEHEKLGEFAAQCGIDVLITAGENAAYLAARAKECGMNGVFAFAETEEAADFAKKSVREGDAVLIKASRGMGFERVYNALRNKTV